MLIIMPLLLRTISLSRWWDHEAHPWLSEDSSKADGIPAAALLDLIKEPKESEQVPNTQGLITISVWQINDDRSNLGQVVTALAANRHKISHLDYALFDRDLLLKQGFKIKFTQGKTPCAVTNKLHCNLIELSVHKITELAKIIMINERKRLSKKLIEHLTSKRN